MVPINRIKRWPFPGNVVLNTLADDEQLRVPGEEMLSLYGALTTAIGLRDGRKVFDFLKRLASEAAERSSGVPCIFFKDEMGEFVGLEVDASEHREQDDGDGGDSEAESGPDDVTT